MPRVPAILVVVLVAFAGVAAGDGDPIPTAADLFAKCSATDGGRQSCYAYIRGFSDGNRWLLRDESVFPSGSVSHAVCIPNAEPVARAADLFVARFRGREVEVNNLSPFRALSVALSSRYPCEEAR